MKKFISIMLATVMTLSLVACSNGEGGNGTGGTGSEDTIKIGVFLPLTGESAGGGELEKMGIDIAHELYPEVLGKKIELVVADNKSDKAEAAAAASRLIEKDKVVAILGSYGSSLSMAAGEVVKSAQVPAVSTSATNPQVTFDNDFYFRTCFIDPYQGSVMANYAMNDLGAKTAVILQEISNDYSVGLANFFATAFKEVNGEDSIVNIYNYQSNDKDFSAQLTNIKADNPDVVFAPGGFTESALAIKQARQMGIETPFLGGDTWETNDFLSVGGAEVEGATLSTAFARESANTEESKIFLEAYDKNNDEEPSALTALGYDTYLMVRDAIERANSADPIAIRDALAETVDFEGATGLTTLDENGDAIKPAVIKEVKDGKFQYKQTVSTN
ncbi:MAG: ABC transporter substrate-binding protein [Tissierellia bacterium]|nr:ABC transporter substrate-binding protein [Tissierellia bacterium]